MCIFSVDDKYIPGTFYNDTPSLIYICWISTSLKLIIKTAAPFILAVFFQMLNYTF